MSTRITTPIVEDFAYLARKMRGDEIAQFLAVSGMAEYSPDIAARCFVMTGGPSFVLIGSDGLPVAAGGFEEIRQRVYQTWMLGTMDGWAQHWRALTKHSRRLMDELFENGAQRIQTYALDSRRAAHAWYARGLRQRYEGTHACFYADGQAAVCYARTIDMHWEGADGQFE